MQAVGHAGIEKHLDRTEWDDEALGDAIERQTNLEPLVIDEQVPEAMLKHDRHLFGVSLLQPRGEGHTWCVGVEGNVKVVLSGQTGLGNLKQHSANDAAQRILRQGLVVDVVLARHRQQNATGLPWLKE